MLEEHQNAMDRESRAEKLLAETRSPHFSEKKRFDTIAATGRLDLINRVAQKFGINVFDDIDVQIEAALLMQERF